MIKFVIDVVYYGVQLSAIKQDYHIKYKEWQIILQTQIRRTQVLPIRNIKYRNYTFILFQLTQSSNLFREERQFNAEIVEYEPRTL